VFARSSDNVIISGENFSSVEVEGALMRHPPFRKSGSSA
jgi:acyl-CoA synthetase (AMP-forming)/AMP-acid ligase II